MLWKRVVQRAGSLTVRALGKTRYAMRAARARRVLQAQRITEGAPLQLVRWSNIVAASKLPETLTADLVLGRRGAYVEPLLAAYERYLGQLLRIGKPEKISVPSDAALVRNIVHSTLAFYMRKQRDQVYTLDLGRLAGLPFFHGYGEVIGARVDRAAGTLAFQTTFGREYSAGDPLYDLAKLHFISCSYIFQVAVAHSWVHFHFPDIISALHYNLGLRAPGSVLYKLLAPHTRFVLALSESVLRTERNSIDNRPGPIALLSPIRPAPVLYETFIAGNSRRTADFYADGGGFHCPPRFETDLPYVEVALRFYAVIREFVGELAPHLEGDLLAGMMRGASEHIPAIRGFDPLDVLATFIWQVAVVHSSDHFAFYKGYGHNATAHDDITVMKGQPVFPTVMTRSLRDCTPSTTLDEVADPIYVHRSQHHMAVFSRYNRKGALDVTLPTVDYGFGASVLDESARRFQAGLRDLEKTLIAENKLICPLEEMAPSICF